MTNLRRDFDWRDAYARLERIGRALGETAARPEDDERILRERARLLARPRAEAGPPDETLELLVFSLGSERFALETASVQEVIPLRELVPVPCVPPFVLGVVNHRGRILPILDVRTLFAQAGEGLSEGGRAVAVETAGMRFGIFADTVTGVVRIPPREVSPPPVTLTGGGHAFVRGVTAEMVAVLDLEAIARDPRVMVNDEVG